LGADSTNRHSLVNLLLGSEDRAAAACHHSDWLPIVLLAEAWHVLPQLDARISSLHLTLDPDSRLALRKKSSLAFMRSMLVARRGLEALQLLERNGVQAAAFKGLASMATLYPNPALRSIQDADVLIPEPQLAAAIAVVSQLGLRPDLPDDLGAYLDFVANSPGFGGNHAISMHGDNQAELDLHWRLGFASAGELDPSRVIGRAQSVSFLGSAMRVVHPSDALLLTTCHSLRNNFAPAFICRDLLDFCLCADLLSDTGELHSALNRARESGLFIPLSAMCRIRARFDVSYMRHDSVIEIESQSTARERTDAAALAHLFDSQLNRGTLNKDVVYLVQRGPIKQIAAGLTKDWRRYRKFMGALEVKAEGTPASLRKRLTELVRVAIRLRPADLRSLRALASVKHP
jgi:hypothetical protein